MNILITGGTGFIGSALTKFFIQKGYLTTILSSNSPALSSVRIIKSIEQNKRNTRRKQRGILEES